jgi:hypothetical protein
MPRDGAIIFRDIVGKLTVLRITCDKCGRSGQYRVDRPNMRYGINAKLFAWFDESRGRLPAEASAKLERPMRRRVSGSVESCLSASGVRWSVSLREDHRYETFAYVRSRTCDIGRCGLQVRRSSQWF